MFAPMKTSALLGVFVLALGAGGCDKKISQSKTQDFLKELLKGKGVPNAEVTCPADIPAKKDGVFTCQMKAEGLSFEAEVKQLDDAGNVNARIKNIYLPGELSKVLQASARNSVPDATADCGSEKIKVGKKGDKVLCKVKTSAGDQDVTIEIKDDYGAAEIVAAPPAPAPEPTPAPTEPAAPPAAGDHPAEPPAGDHPADPPPAEPAHE